jgi:hypothetical protein
MPKFGRWPERTWLLEIRGEDSGLRYLSHLLETAEIRLVEIDGGFYLDAPTLRAAASDEEAHDEAEDSFKILKGLMFLHGLELEFTEETLVRTSQNKENLDRSVRLRPVVGKTRLGFLTATGGVAGQPSPYQPKSENWIKLALTRPTVAFVLRPVSYTQLTLPTTSLV